MLQPAVAEELAVLGRDDRVAQDLGNLLVGDDLRAARSRTRRRPSRHGASTRVIVLGRVVVERGNLGEVADEREEDAAGRAEQRRAEEQRDQAEAPNQARSEPLHPFQSKP